MTERDILDAFARMPARREPRTTVLRGRRPAVRVDVALDTTQATRPIVQIDTEEYEVVFSGRGFVDGRGLSHAGGGSSLAGTHQVVTRRTGEARRG